MMIQIQKIIKINNIKLTQHKINEYVIKFSLQFKRILLINLFE